MDVEELCHEIQYRVKENQVKNRDKEWYNKATKAREVFIEGFDRIFHVLLDELEDLGVQESFKKMFRCFLPKVKDKEETHTEK